MNVAIFASAFHPHIGGVEELVRQLAHAYRKQGARAIVITHRWPTDLPAEETFEGIQIYRLPMPLPDELNGWAVNFKSRVVTQLHRKQNCAQIEAILRRHQSRVLHVQCVGGNGFYALQAARALNLPLVVSAQGELSMDASQMYQRSPSARAMLRDVLRGADFITACSASTLAEVEAFYGSAFGERVRPIYNGIALDDFENVRPHAHARPYILGIGRLVMQKGFDVLLRAFAEANCPNFDLILAGDGPEKSALENLARELKLENRAHLIGNAARAKAIALFKGCAFFVLPSRHEPMGIVNLEAMAAGKAVVATRVGGVPEIVIGAQNEIKNQTENQIATESQTGILVAPDDVDDLARALSTLAADAAVREALGRAGAARAREFDWSRIATQYLEIYRAVSGELSTPAPHYAAADAHAQELEA